MLICRMIWENQMMDNIGSSVPDNVNKPSQNIHASYFCIYYCSRIIFLFKAFVQLLNKNCMLTCTLKRFSQV